MGDSINLNLGGLKRNFGKANSFFKQKKVINIIFIILFLSVLIGGYIIRTQNLPLLTDSTTGEYIPLALDPFYFLRVAEVSAEPGGLPDIDTMRYPSAEVEFTKEILPQSVVLLYKVFKIFDGDTTLRYVHVLSPVIFFILGLIVFFLLAYVLTNSKSAALLSGIFLTISPPYLNRTLAGFADHESIGMFAFFLVLLAYSLALKFLNKERRGIYKALFWGALVGLLSFFTIIAWNGISKFVFMIIPFSFILFWLIKVKDVNVERKTFFTLLIFYLAFFISSIFFGWIYGFSLSSMFDRIFLSSTSMVNGAVLLFLFIDYFMIKFKEKLTFIKKEKLEKYRALYSALSVLIIGAIFISIFKGGLFSLISGTLEGFIHPFGTGRVGLTVAENRQPFLNEWIAQIGKILFWLFVGGLIVLGVELAKGIGRKKHKFWFGLLWIVFILGILFSRISSSSLFNGENFISNLFYIGSLILFFIYMAWTYFNDNIKIRPELLVFFAWAFFMLISARGALRLFFVITPFICLSAGFFVRKIYDYTRNAKDDLLKMFLWIILILVFVGVIISANSLYDITNTQAKFTGPSAGAQWQQAMSWVRENTAQDGIFVHWWDYGHWVTYLGERAVVTDGGHAVGYWDHLIGRYVLTTPKPETALSFMKSHDVSYLLIDPSDLGKYGAYSRIGSDETGEDRFSQIPVMVLDPGQTRENANVETRVYVGGVPIDEDIVYNSDGRNIFLPANRAFIAATIVEVSRDVEGGQISFNTPQGIFIYNNQQINIPLRYIYLEGEIIDFGVGIDAVVRLIPQIHNTGQGIQIDNFGSAIYLSPKVSNGLFAQLYLMDDPFDNYPTIRLAHSEPDPFIGSLNQQGASLGDLVYFQGLRGSLKIWDVGYPENILEKEEFLRTSGELAEFDNLQFTR